MNNIIRCLLKPITVIALLAPAGWAARAPVGSARPNILLIIYKLSFGKRPADALFRLIDDPECVRSLGSDLAFIPVLTELRARMMTLLRESIFRLPKDA